MFEHDGYVEELQVDRGEAVWRAELSDGTVATMDDGRPGCEPRSAWLRLAAHCEDRGLSVVKLWLEFRSNAARDILPERADGYFFSKCVLGMFNAADTLSFYLVGSLHQGKLVVQRWKVPELLLLDVEERDAGYSGPCLIRSRHADRGATNPVGGPPG